jgi:hypothetical protein
MANTNQKGAEERTLNKKESSDRLPGSVVGESGSPTRGGKAASAEEFNVEMKENVVGLGKRRGKSRRSPAP